MRLLITGAAGFLGQYVVEEAIRRGHEVHALVRPMTDVSRLAWNDHTQASVVWADLRSRQGLVEAVGGVDAVLHLAAGMTGDFYAQFAGSVVATENLLWAMSEAGIKRLVSISSLAVYDYTALRNFTTVDEDSPVEDDPLKRDAYAQTKLWQENCVREYAATHGLAITILRPGVIYGKDHCWTFRLGQRIGSKLWLRVGATGQIPLSYVKNCAQAVVLSAERSEVIGQTFNVIDDDPPSQRGYAAEIRRLMLPGTVIIPVPWIMARGLATFVWWINQTFCDGQMRVPGLFIPAWLDGRAKPLRYSNHHLRQMLGWRPRYTRREALEEIFSASENTRLTPEYEESYHGDVLRERRPTRQ